MARRSLYPLADRLLEGRLAELLTTARQAGESYETIARQLNADHGLDISGTTVRRWFQQLDTEAVA
jgi:intein-encoded DNA endonuclease-like protein